MFMCCSRARVRCSSCPQVVTFRTTGRAAREFCKARKIRPDAPRPSSATSRNPPRDFAHLREACRRPVSAASGAGSRGALRARPATCGNRSTTSAGRPPGPLPDGGKLLHGSAAGPTRCSARDGGRGTPRRPAARPAATRPPSPRRAASPARRSRNRESGRHRGRSGSRADPRAGNPDASPARS